MLEVWWRTERKAQVPHTGLKAGRSEPRCFLTWRNIPHLLDWRIFFDILFCLFYIVHVLSCQMLFVLYLNGKYWLTTNDWSCSLCFNSRSLPRHKMKRRLFYGLLSEVSIRLMLLIVFLWVYPPALCFVNAGWKVTQIEQHYSRRLNGNEPTVCVFAEWQSSFPRSIERSSRRRCGFISFIVWRWTTCLQL